MEVMLVIEPIPGRDDDVALDALRARRLRMGQLPFGDAVRPVGQIADRRSAELFDGGREHRYSSLSRLDAAKPRFLGIFERWEGMRHVLGKRAHRAHALRMAVGAAVRL